MNRVFGLDLMRAIAILLVVMGHGTDFLGAVHAQFNILFSIGFFGVELFFVLSGFLIGRILLDLIEPLNNFCPRDFRIFWIRRWYRTLPNYFLFLFLNFLLAGGLGLTLTGSYLYPLFLQNWIWLQPEFFPESWSLAVEEWFYLGFPILICFFGGRTSSPRKAFLLATIAFFLLPLVLRGFNAFILERPFDSGMRKMVVMRLDSLMFGVFAAYVKKFHPECFYRWRLCKWVMGLVICITVFHFLNTLDLDASAWMKTFGFTATSIGAALMLPFFDAWKSASGKIATGITCISLWSYSLYLCHRPVAVLLQHFLHAENTLSPSAGLTGFFIYVPVSIILSALCFRYYEKPMTQLRERFRS